MCLRAQVFVRVLVTGATGSAGTIILRRLLTTGHGSLFGTYRSRPSPAFLAEFAVPLAEGRLQLLRQDLAELTPDQGPEVEAVIHCAARRPASRCASDPVAATRDNIVAVRHLVEWSRQRNVGRFLHFSIHSVYAPGRPPYRETDPVLATDIQVAAKLESEAIVAQGLGTGVHHLILRLPHFHGAELPCDGVIAAFVKGARGGELFITGDGEQAVCFIELRDLAELIVELLAAPPPAGIYNAASETITVNALAGIFQQCWREQGHREPALRHVGGAQPAGFGLDMSKLFAASHWRPRHFIEEKIRRLADSPEVR